MFCERERLRDWKQRIRRTEITKKEMEKQSERRNDEKGHDQEQMSNFISQICFRFFLPDWRLIQFGSVGPCLFLLFLTKMENLHKTLLTSDIKYTF